jgi:hypothetical protein
LSDEEAEKIPGMSDLIANVHRRVEMTDNGLELSEKLKTTTASLLKTESGEYLDMSDDYDLGDFIESPIIKIEKIESDHFSILKNIKVLENISKDHYEF